MSKQILGLYLLNDLMIDVVQVKQGPMCSCGQVLCDEVSLENPRLE